MKRSDESRVLAIVTQALEGEGPDAGGVGPYLRAVVHLAERLASKRGVDLQALLAARLELGREHYGALDLATDKRDFQREALEDLADCLFYLGAEVLRRTGRPRGGRL